MQRLKTNNESKATSLDTIYPTEQITNKIYTFSPLAPDGELSTLLVLYPGIHPGGGAAPTQWYIIVDDDALLDLPDLPIVDDDALLDLPDLPIFPKLLLPDLPARP